MTQPPPPTQASPACGPAAPWRCAACTAKPVWVAPDMPLPDMHSLVTFEQMLVQALNASCPQARLGSIVKGAVMLKRWAGAAKQAVAGRGQRLVPLTYADTQRTVPQGWSCPRCTDVNSPTRPVCELCEAALPANVEPEALVATQQQGLLRGMEPPHALVLPPRERSGGSGIQNFVHHKRQRNVSPTKSSKNNLVTARGGVPMPEIVRIQARTRVFVRARGMLSTET